MKEWQFDVLFIVGVAGSVLILIGPSIGLEKLGNDPLAVSGIGTILAYVLTQRRHIVQRKKDKTEKSSEETEDSNDE